MRWKCIEKVMQHYKVIKFDMEFCNMRKNLKMQKNVYLCKV